LRLIERSCDQGDRTAPFPAYKATDFHSHITSMIRRVDACLDNTYIKNISMPAKLTHRTMALAVILTVQLMLAMDFLIVIVSLKNIQSDLGFTIAGLS